MSENNKTKMLMRAEINTIGRDVAGISRKDIPKADETIIEIMDLAVVEALAGIQVYRRGADSGYTPGWIIDLYFDDGKINYLRLPYDMTKDAVFAYVKPLSDAFEAAAGDDIVDKLKMH